MDAKVAIRRPELHASQAASDKITSRGEGIRNNALKEEEEER